MYYDQWKSKAGFKEYVKNLQEFGQLDQLVMDYIETKLHHKIIRKPQKGKEDGKDIVAVEDEMTGEYCCYVVKRGNLTCSALKGKCGVLKQIEEAMLIELEESEYYNKKRTVIVVYNGEKVTRDANKKYYSKKYEVEKLVGDLLLRPIEKWDLNYIVDEFFSIGCELKAREETRLWYEKLNLHQKLNLHKSSEAQNLINCDAPKGHLKLFVLDYIKSVEDIEREYNI